MARTSSTSGSARQARSTLPPAEPVAPKRRIFMGRGYTGNLAILPAGPRP